MPNASSSERRQCFDTKPGWRTRRELSSLRIDGRMRVGHRPENPSVGVRKSLPFGRYATCAAVVQLDLGTRQEVDRANYRFMRERRAHLGRRAMVDACRIVFDRSRCASMGLCEMVAPDMFELDDDGVLTVRSEVVDGARRAEMEAVAMGCPTQSLRIVDA